jgi:ABC-type transport system involved in cytochrome c biogenesis ATPase subunit
MLSSGMRRRMALVRTDVSEQRIASIIKMTRIAELGTTVLTRATRRHIPEDGFPHSHRRENVKYHNIGAVLYKTK